MAIIQSNKNTNLYKFYTEEEKQTIHDVLPSGNYKLTVSIGLLGVNVIFEKTNMLETVVEPTKSKQYNLIKDSILNFFNKDLQELYKDLNYLNKKGILIHGKPGTGKTASVNFLAEKIAKEKNGIVLQVGGEAAISQLPNIIDNLRETNKELPIMLVLDECENYFKDSTYIENLMLNILDGKNSKDNTLFIFITNKLDKIPERFTKRPSRIRDIVEYNETPYEVIFEILSNKIPAKYQGMINIQELSFKYSEAGKTIDEAKTDAISNLEKIVLELAKVELTALS